LYTVYDSQYFRLFGDCTTCVLSASLNISVFWGTVLLVYCLRFSIFPSVGGLYIRLLRDCTTCLLSRFLYFPFLQNLSYRVCVTLEVLIRKSLRVFVYPSMCLYRPDISDYFSCPCVLLYVLVFVVSVSHPCVLLYALGFVVSVNSSCGCLPLLVFVYLSL
jgi:hypothetical protein